MSHYFLVLDAGRLHCDLAPSLAASWRQRSFVPLRPVAAAVLPAALDFLGRYRAEAEEPLLAQVAHGLPFDRHVWTLLAGELFLYAAVEVPELQVLPETLCCLLAPEQYRQGVADRPQFAPIQQAHFGSRDLIFGGRTYRPEAAGLNDVDDVARLADYLAAVRPEQWTIDHLRDLREPADPEDRADELEFAREWFPPLADLYRRASEQGRVVLCEILVSAIAG